MTLRQKRCEFTLCKAKLIIWIFAQGWEVASGEGYVALTARFKHAWQSPHKERGAHDTGLGEDLLLYVDGKYIVEGTHPAWLAIGTMWESMHELARWGGRFGDANHISFEHEGRK